MSVENTADVALCISETLFLLRCTRIMSRLVGDAQFRLRAAGSFSVTKRFSDGIVLVALAQRAASGVPLGEYLVHQSGYRS